MSILFACLWIFNNALCFTSIVTKDIKLNHSDKIMQNNVNWTSRWRGITYFTLFVYLVGTKHINGHYIIKCNVNTPELAELLISIRSPHTSNTKTKLAYKTWEDNIQIYRNTFRKQIIKKHHLKCIYVISSVFNNSANFLLK